MRLASLGSGSKGNATLLRCDTGCVLIDCGYSLAQFEKRLSQFGMPVEEIDAVLVTHEHADHGAGIRRLLSRYEVPLWTTVGTARQLELSTHHVISGGQEFTPFDGLRVQAVTVPHDAAEPVQFVFTQLSDGRRFGLLTDCGHVTSHMQEVYTGLHGLLLEFNYDEEMLANGPYPPVLKRRIAGPHGHLSNNQSSQMLLQMDTSQLQLLIAAHISEKNNAPQRVQNSLKAHDGAFRRLLATQQDGFDWIQL